MLPTAHRLRTGEDFRRTVRGGRKAGTRTLVAHLAAPPPVVPDQGDTPGSGAAGSPPAVAGTTEPRVGLAVSRAVGNAVTRNRVKRQLRHLARPRLAALPPGSSLVVRALPAAAGATSAQLGHDLDRALARVAERDARGAAAGSRP